MRPWGSAAVAFLVACGIAGAAQSAPKVGQPAPDFTVTTFGGHKVKLADLKGDVIVLNFWATWCAPCRKELPLLEGAFKAYNKYGFQVLAVATENSVPEYELRPLAAKMTIPFVKDIRGPYQDLGAVPTNYIIDRSGKLVYAKAAAFDPDSLNAIIVPLLQQPIPDISPPPAPASAEPPPPTTAPATTAVPKS
jgi:peroxiredoxin